MKKTSLLAIFLLLGFLLNAQSTTTIPLPENVRHGRLENGMTYFIMHNEEPKDRVSFYFAQRVGAILEEDDEDGLAHFLEHMAFNGSKNFPDRSMDRYLESKGLLFGRDFNAYTSTDETLYNIDNVPAADAELVDKCLLMMHDWSGSLDLVGKDIDEERGVIGEEWRSGRTPDTRIYEKQMPVMYAGSKYAKRDIIGKLDFINSFKHESLRNYYKKWYRPDLQSVVVVGDIDVDQMETKIKALFSKIPLVSNAKERPYFDIPDNKEVSYVLATDKGSSNVNFTWMFKQKKTSVKDEAYIRKTLVEELFSAMMTNRYNEKLQLPSASATQIGVSLYDLSPSSTPNYLEVIPKKGKFLQAVKDSYTEIERVQRFGFLPSELAREKQNMITSYEVAIKEEAKKDNATWAYDLSRYFFDASPILKAQNQFDLVQKLLASITLEDAKEVADKFKNIDNSMILISGPENKTIAYPTKEKILDIVQKIRESKLASYEDNVKDEPLISEILSSKPIKETFEIKGIPTAKGFVLGNGAKVILMPSKKSGKNVMLAAKSFGGLSKVQTEAIQSASLASELAGLSGLGNFNAVQLDKKRAGKTASVETYIGDYAEYLEGISTVKDIELLLQLTYLSFENPRFDKDLFEAQIPEWKEYIVRSKEDDQSIFNDSILLATYNRNPRKMPLVPSDMNKVNFEKSKAIYKQRFSDADDFTFMFIGNFDNEKILPLIQKYLGNIKALPTQEHWADNNVRYKEGVTRKHFVRKMINPQTSIYYKASGLLDYTLKNELIMNVIGAILDTRYVDTIREEEGGSYGVSVYGSMERIPENRFSLDVQFDCNPDKHEKLLAIVKEEIEKLATEGPSKSYVEKAKKNLLKDRTELVTDDSFWLEQLDNTLFFNQNYVPIKDYKKLVQTITPELIKDFAKKNIMKSDIIEVVMSPKKEVTPKLKK